MVIPELEAAVQDLSRETWVRDAEWCAERFGEFFGGLDAFGLAGPSQEESLDAGLWFLLDCPLPDGQTPLWRRRQSVTGRAVELLVRSELRAWRVESVGPDGLLSGVCPLGSGRARLETIRGAIGDLRPGAMVVARSVPLGPERWALLGRAPVVDPAVAADFDLLLASLDAPLGSYWRVHGGVLSHAAWSWPEVRETTTQGETVEDSQVTVVVLDPYGVEAALDADPDFHRADGCTCDESIAWRWRWDPPAARRIPDEPGVRLRLASQDADDAPYLATVTLDASRRELLCLAPTPVRLGLARRLLGQRLDGRLGATGSVRISPPEVTLRWKRLRLPDVRPAVSTASLRPSWAA